MPPLSILLNGVCTKAYKPVASFGVTAVDGRLRTLVDLVQLTASCTKSTSQ